ncbi:MAG: hypothetical protein ACK5KS_08435, partial [Planctomyces sp.]
MLTHQHFLRLAFFACMTASLLTRHTSAADPPLQTTHSLPAWILQNDCVSLAITQTGGHMAPATF